MKFSQDLIIAGLRKREGGAPESVERKPKRPRRQEPEQPAQVTGTLPEAILVEDDPEGEAPPSGIPLGEPPRAGLAIAAPVPSSVVEGPSGSGAASEEKERMPLGSADTSAPGPKSLKGVREGPSQPSQTAQQDGPYKSHLAETVLKMAALPKFQAALKELPLDESFDTLFTAALQMSNGLFVIREDLIGAQSRIKSLDKELSETKARESRALKDLQVAQEDNRAWRGKAEEELRALDIKLSEVVARLLPTEEKLKKTSAQLEYTENRADNAEAAARDAAVKLALAEKEVKEAWDKMATVESQARERIAEAEKKTHEAEKKTREAVEEYKASPDFALECREAVMDAFIQGFDRCKRRLSRLYKLGDLGHLLPADDEEEIPDAETDEKAPIESPAGGSLEDQQRSSED